MTDALLRIPQWRSCSLPARKEKRRLPRWLLLRCYRGSGNEEVIVWLERFEIAAMGGPLPGWTSTTSSLLMRSLRQPEEASTADRKAALAAANFRHKKLDALDVHG